MEKQRDIPPGQYPCLPRPAQVAKRWADELACKPDTDQQRRCRPTTTCHSKHRRDKQGIGSVGRERVIDHRLTQQAMIGLLGRLGGRDGQVWAGHCLCAVVPGR